MRARGPLAVVVLFATMAATAAVALPARAATASTPDINSTFTWSRSATNQVSVEKAAMAYDPAIHKLVMYAQDYDEGNAVITYVGSPSSLSPVNTSTQPTYSVGSVMVYDPSLQKILYVDSADGSTWTFDGSVWAKLSPTMAAPGDEFDAMVWDTSLSEAVLADTGGNTWTFNGTTWNKLSATGPSARNRMHMVYDTATSQVLLFGGEENNGDADLLGDFWSFNGTTWTQLHPANLPPATAGGSMVYLPNWGRIVLFGGLQEVNVNGDTYPLDTAGTYTYNGTTWSTARQNDSQENLLERQDASSAYDSDTGQMVLASGGQEYTFNTPAQFNDIWTYSFGQTIDFDSSPSNPQTAGTYTPSASSDSGLNVTITLDPASTACTMSNGVVSFQNGGTCVLDANQAGSADESAAPQAQQQFTVEGKSQTITYTSMPSSSLVVGESYTPSATATSGLAVSFTVDDSSTACSRHDVNRSGAILITHAGTCVVDANQAGDTTNWAPAKQVQQSFTTGAGPQTVAFTSTAPGSPDPGDTYTPTATATSGLAATFSIDNPAQDICTISSGVVTFQSPGNCVIDADQAGNSDYTAAPTVQQTVVVANQEVVFDSTPPDPAYIGAPTYTPVANSTSGLPVRLSLDAASTGCTLSDSVVSFTAVGTCVIDADQAGGGNFTAAKQVAQSIPVISQVVSFISNAPTEASVGGAAYEPVGSASSGQPVTFGLASDSTGCRIDNGLVIFTEQGNCDVEAIQAGTGGYQAASTDQSFAVAAGTATYIWSKVSASTSPTARSGAAMAYDPQTRDTVLFGGSVNGAPNDETWTFDGSTWTEQHPATSPPARSGAAMTYWAPNNELVMIGGVGAGGSSIDDAWAYNGTTWSELDSSTGIDSTAGVQLVDGSANCNAACLIAVGSGQTWFGLGNFWVNETQTALPINGALGFDPTTKTAYYFGGLSSDGSHPVATTWNLTTNGQTQVTTPNAPPAAANSSLIFDPVLDQLVLYGGGDNETWTFDGTNWSQLATSDQPDAVQGAAVAGVPNIGDVLFGGSSGATALNETWEYTPAASQSVSFTSPDPGSGKVGGTYSPTIAASSGLPVRLSVDAATTNDACSVAADGTDVDFDHVGDCVLDANQPGNGDYAAATSISQTVPVGQGTTTTAITITPTTITADVSPSDASDLAIGDVTFSVGGATVGTATLDDGTATLNYSVPTAMAQTVAASYPGDVDYTGSSDSLSRQDPTISATISSSTAKSKAGWYRTPVTVAFTCTPNGAAITGGCPQSVTLSRSAAKQSVTTTIVAADGGAATVVVSGIDIDRVAPTLTVNGVKSRASYKSKRTLKCVAIDQLSGVASCTIKQKITRHGNVHVDKYTAVAVDRAGNTKTVYGHYSWN